MIDFLHFQYAIYVLIALTIVPIGIQYLNTIQMYLRNKINYNNFEKKHHRFYPKKNQILIGYYIGLTALCTFAVLYFLFLDFTLYVYFLWYLLLVLIVSGIGILREFTQNRYVLNIEPFVNIHHQIKEIEDNTEKFLANLSEEQAKLDSLHSHYNSQLKQLQVRFIASSNDLSLALKPLETSKEKLVSQLTHMSGYIEGLKKDFNHELHDFLYQDKQWTTRLSSLDDIVAMNEEISIHSIESQIISRVNEYLVEKIKNQEYVSANDLIDLINDIEKTKFSIKDINTIEFLDIIRTLTPNESSHLIQILYDGDYLDVEELITIIAKQDWEWLMNERLIKKLNVQQINALINMLIEFDALNSTMAFINLTGEQEYRIIRQLLDTHKKDSDTSLMIKYYLELFSYENSFINPSNRAEMFTVILYEYLSSNTTKDNEKLEFVQTLLETGEYDLKENEIIDLYLDIQNELSNLHETASVMLVHYQRYMNQNNIFVDFKAIKSYLNECLIILKSEAIVVTIYTMMMLILINNQEDHLKETFIGLVNKVNANDYHTLRKNTNIQDAKAYYQLLSNRRYQSMFINIMARIEKQRLTVERINTLFSSGGVQ